LGPNAGGASVTIPNKEIVFPLVQNLSEHAKIIGAVNTLVKLGGGRPEILGDNTDWVAIKNLLEKKLEGKKKIEKGDLQCLIIGAGGTSRAACYAIRQLSKGLGRNIETWIANRTLEKAEKLGSEFSLKVHTDLSLPSVSGPPDIIISTIPLAAQADFLSSVGGWLFASNPIVLDLVYKPRRTPILEAAREARLRNGVEEGGYDVEGIDILLEQGFLQFQIWTGTPIAPKMEMRRAVYESLEAL